MNESDFNTAMTYAISNGLTPIQALNYTYFMATFKPEDLHLQSSYAKTWIDRFKEEPLACMDVHCTAIYNAVTIMTSTYISGIPKV